MEETNRQYPQTPLQAKPAPSGGEDVIDDEGMTTRQGRRRHQLECTAHIRQSLLAAQSCLTT